MSQLLRKIAKLFGFNSRVRGFKVGVVLGLGHRNTPWGDLKITTCYGYLVTTEIGFGCLVLFLFFTSITILLTVMYVDPPQHCRQL